VESIVERHGDDALAVSVEGRRGQRHAAVTARGKPSHLAREDLGLDHDLAVLPRRAETVGAENEGLPARR
jgi:hypothetical protein